MDTTRSKTTLRTAIVVNLAPIGVFTVMILAVTGVVLGEVTAWTEILSSELAAGELTDARMHEVGSALRFAWLGSLAFFLLFALGTGALSAWVFRLVRRRLEGLVTFVEDRTAGREVASIATSGTGPLAVLESSIERVTDAVQERDSIMARESRLSCLDTKLQRALDLVDTEEDALEVIELALSKVVPDLPAEVLLADSSRAHLRRRAVSPAAEAPACPVSSPQQCAAIRRGATMEFESSQDLDACPRLRERDCGAQGALCTPLNVMGRSIGVLHLRHPAGQPVAEDVTQQLEVIATHTGARLGMIRTLASTQLQAQTDPLTGLMNRRSFEACVIREALGLEDVDCAVCMADLDHFKKLNDTAGHEAGDRALKLFASVVKENLRPEDIVGRHGGEEFTIFFPRSDASSARVALDRLRAALRAAGERYGGPTFTCSFGVASTRGPIEALGPLLERADRMLYAAKEAGRDRVVTDVDDPEALSPSAPPPSAEVRLAEVS